MDNEIVYIACYGSALNLQSNGIGWAWADSENNWQSSGYYEGSAGLAELHAIRSALIFHPNKRIIIELVSVYAFNIVTGDGEKWRANSWKLSSRNKRAKHVEVISPILEILRNRKDQIEFKVYNKNSINVVEDLHHIHKISKDQARKASGRAGHLNASNIIEESLKLYNDSKGREKHDLERSSMLKIINSMDRPSEPDSLF